MVAPKSNALRVAVGDPRGRRSSTWRVWFGDTDIYAAIRALGGRMKATVHYPRPPKHPGTRRVIAFTHDFFRSEAFDALPGAPRDGSRTMLEFPGYEFAPGFFLEVRLQALESGLAAFEAAEPSDTVWLPAPSPGFSAEVFVISAPPEYQGPLPSRSDGAPVGLLAEGRFATGRRVWVAHHVVPEPAASQLEDLRTRTRDQLGDARQRLPRGPNIRMVVVGTSADGAGLLADLGTAWL